MILANNEHIFNVKIKGEKSGEWYEGSFTTRCILNNEQTIEVALRTDRYNNGSKSLAPTFALMNRMISELEVRLIKKPTWWTESDGGRLLFDQNVLMEVFNKALEGEDVWAKRLKDKAETETKETEK